jgi:hypothetical protein
MKPDRHDLSLGQVAVNQDQFTELMPSSANLRKSQLLENEGYEEE